MTASGSREQSALFGILLLAAGVRISMLFLFQGHGLTIWDERDYDKLATSITERGEFAYESGRPVAIRPPLYPALVAVLYGAFGLHSYQAVRLCQILLSLGTLLLVYDLGARLFCKRIGLWAAGWYALYPSLILYCGLILTETLFTFLLVLFLWMLSRAVDHGSWRRLLIAGVILGLAALTRSVLWLFSVPLGLLLLFYWPGSVVRRITAAAVLAIAFAMTLAPWAIRNTLLEDTFVAVDTMGGRNLMMGNYEHTPFARAWATIAIEGDDSWHRVLHRKHPEAAIMSQGQIDKLALREGILYAANHPWLTLQRDLVKLVAFWGLERELVAGVTHESFGKWSAPATVAFALVVMGAYAATILLVVFGVLLVPANNRFLLILIVTTVAYVCALHTLSFGHSRYHLPLMPLLFPFAAAACVGRKEIWQKRGTRVFCVAVFFVSAMLVAWVAEAAIQDWDRIVKILCGVI